MKPFKNFTFGCFWVLLGAFCVLLGNFGYYWVLLGSFGLFWVLLGAGWNWQTQTDYRIYWPQLGLVLIISNQFTLICFCIWQILSLGQNQWQLQYTEARNVPIKRNKNLQKIIITLTYLQNIMLKYVESIYRIYQNDRKKYILSLRMLRGSRHIASILTIVPEAPYLEIGFYTNFGNVIQPFSYL